MGKPRTTFQENSSSKRKPQKVVRGKLYIGTSGWVYSHWEKIFYPEDLAPKNKLKYFSQQFKTSEVNYSFYHLPSPATYQNWHSQTPVDFLFALKASRFITHIKRLKGVKEAWKVFIKNALNLKEKLGPILFQFPPSFKATPENIKRLEEFLEFISLKQSVACKRDRVYKRQDLRQLRSAFEFRHKTWCQEKIYKILKKYKAAWVIADSPRYPKVEKVTANFVYVRLHGSKVLFSSKYTKKELKELSQKIKKWLNPVRDYKGKEKTQGKQTPLGVNGLREKSEESKPLTGQISNGVKQGKDVFVYFNNDAYGYAIENAKTLKGLLAACPHTKRE